MFISRNWRKHTFSSGGWYCIKIICLLPGTIFEVFMLFLNQCKLWGYGNFVNLPLFNCFSCNLLTFLDLFEGWFELILSVVRLLLLLWKPFIYIHYNIEIIKPLPRKVQLQTDRCYLIPEIPTGFLGNAFKFFPYGLEIKLILIGFTE